MSRRIGTRGVACRRCNAVGVGLPVIGAMLLALAAPAHGEDFGGADLLFEDIPSVVSASLFEEKLLTAPSSMIVMTTDDIWQTGARELRDAFTWVPGADTLNAGFNPAMSVRGFTDPYKGRVLVLMDGVVLYNYMNGLTYWNLVPIIAENVGSVEIVRGPGGATFGANSMLGVVNMSSREIAPENEARTMAWVRVGSPLVTDATVITENRTDAAAWRFSAAYLGDEGFSDDVNEDDYSYSGTFGAEVELAAGMDAALNIAGHFRMVTFDRAETGTIFLAGQNDTAFSIFTVKYDKELASGALAIQANDSIMAVDAADGGSLRTQTDDVRVQLSTQVGEKNKLVYGAMAKIYSSDDNFITVGDGKYDNSIASVFVQDTISLSDQLTATFGVKSEYDQSIDWFTSPRVALVYAPAGNQSVRASYGKAIKAPSTVEERILFQQEVAPGVFMPVTIGDEDLEAEEADTYEIGYRRFFIGGSLDLTLYKSDFTNLISTVPTSPPPVYLPMQYQNTTKAEALGAELLLKSKLSANIDLDLGFSHQRIVDTETGQRLRNYYQNKATVALTFKSTAGASLRVAFAHFDESTQSTAQSVIETIPAVQRLDMRFGMPVGESGGELVLGGDWLLDYMTRVAIDYEEDRRFYLGYRHMF